MRWRGWHMVLTLAVAAAVVLALSTSAEAQCSMCRAVLTSANNAKFMRGLSIGVLVLLIPPVTIFCSIFIVLRKYRGTD